MSMFYYFNIYYPSNLDRLWKVFDMLSFREYSLNLFKVLGQMSHQYRLDEDKNIDIHTQNSPAKFRLSNITQSFLFNSSGIVFIYLLLILVISSIKMINSFKKKRSDSIQPIEQNLPNLYIFLCIGEISLFVPLQLTGLSFQNKTSYASVILMLVVVA